MNVREIYVLFRGKVTRISRPSAATLCMPRPCIFNEEGGSKDPSLSISTSPNNQLKYKPEMS